MPDERELWLTDMCVGLTECESQGPKCLALQSLVSPGAPTFFNAAGGEGELSIGPGGAGRGGFKRRLKTPHPQLSSDKLSADSFLADPLLKDFRDQDASVRLLVVLKDCDQRTRNCHCGSIERMDERRALLVGNLRPDR